MSECGAQYDEFDGTCEREAGHDGPHAEGTLEWEQASSDAGSDA